MRKTDSALRHKHSRRPVSTLTAALAPILCAALAVPGCFDPVYPQLDRDARVVEALDRRDARQTPPSPLTASQAVIYALANNLDARVAAIETEYHNESAVAARRRMLPSLNLRYSADHSNHPSARWSESTRSGNQSLESSYSSDPNSRHGEVGMMWSLLDFGVGYLKSRQQEERIRHSEEQARRVRQQVVLDVLTQYWRTAAAVAIAGEADALKKELDEQAAAIRDSVEMRILSGAEGARRELAVHGGLAELEQWRRAAVQSKLELARALGCGNSAGFELEPFPAEPPPPPPLPNNDPSSLQAAALQRRPELFQQDSQERVAVDEARIALLQMAPNANLSLSYHDDPDKFLEWSNWMTVGARVSWNLFNIPARLAERRMAKLQGETAKEKGLALAAAIMAQVGIAYSEWKLSNEYAVVVGRRAAARERLVEALAAGERDGQTRPGEVLQERVRLLSEKAAALRSSAEARVAGARLANAIGIDVDGQGRLLWKLDGCDAVDLLSGNRDGAVASARIQGREKAAGAMLPPDLAGLRVVKAEDFEAPAEYFADSSREVSINAMPEPTDVTVNTEGDAWERPIEWELPTAQEYATDFGTELDDMDAAWLRLQPGEIAAKPEVEVASFKPDPVKPGLTETIPARDVPEEVRAMSPASGHFRRVKDLPITSFVPTDGMRKPPRTKEEEIARRNALAPLAPLSEMPEPLGLHPMNGDPLDMNAMDAYPLPDIDGNTIRPSLRPPRTTVEAGSLRPPS